MCPLLLKCTGGYKQLSNTHIRYVECSHPTTSNVTVGDPNSNNADLIR